MTVDQFCGAARAWALSLILGVLAGCGASGKSVPKQGVEKTSTLAQAMTSQNGVGQNGLTTNGFISNGFISNGFISNGFISNGFISNGLFGTGLGTGTWQIFLNNGLWLSSTWQSGPLHDVLTSNQYAPQLLQYMYACAMPPGTNTTLDPYPSRTCTLTPCDAGSDGDPDGGSTCSTQGTCDPGFTCLTNDVGISTCGVPLAGAVGLGVNADKTHWWDPPVAADAGAGDAGTSFAGMCDESCQRWVTACLLARTNAYGVHVEISMRAPSDAPQQVQDALRTTFPEITSCADAGLDASDPSCGYTVREGAYYGNIFATTPEICSDSDAGNSQCVPASPATWPPVSPSTGRIVQTPSFNACAGPDSNVPQITRRFCSSQGDQSVINVPGVCVAPSLEAGTTETGVCDGIEDPTTGPIHGCFGSPDPTQPQCSPTVPCSDGYTCSSQSAQGTCVQTCSASMPCKTTGYTCSPQGTCLLHYNEVITVYLKTPIAVCGNEVCEPPGETEKNCASDCHPGTWTKDYAPNIELSEIDQFYSVVVGMTAVGPDDTIVVAGNASSVSNGPSPPSGIGLLTKYNPDGGFAWPFGEVRFGNGTDVLLQPQLGITSSNGGQFKEVNGVAVASGNVVFEGSLADDITVVGASEVLAAGGTGGPSFVPYESIGVSSFRADGTAVGTWFVPGGSSASLPTLRPTRALAVDSHGNIVLAGLFRGTAIFGDKTLQSTSPALPDIFVAKISPPWVTPPNGSISWANTLKAGFPLSLVVDSHDNVLVVTGNGPSLPGNLYKICADGVFNPTGLGPPVGLCPDGSTPWTKSSGPGSFSAAAVDPIGNVYATGHLATGQDLGGGPIGTDAATRNPPFVVKYNPDGVYKWANYADVVCPPEGATTTNRVGKICGGASSIEGISIGFDSSGNPVLASFGDPAVGGGIDFSGVVVCNNAPIPKFSTFPTYHANNIFLSAYSADCGQTVWAQQLPAILSSSILGFSLDSKARVVVGGNYSGSMLADGRLLVTPVSEDPAVIDSFLASFSEPPLKKTSLPVLGTIVDQTGALIDTVPKDLVVPATSPAGAVVFFMPPTATDDGTAAASVVCSPKPNTMFPIGSTTVTCIAFDPLNNKSEPKTFKVTVLDTLAPVFSAVADITVQATSPSGVNVVYPLPTATDPVDGPIPPSQIGCTPASGTLFAVGQKTVVCTASDSETPPKTSQTTFVVTVTPPPPAPTVTCVGTQSAPAIVSTSPGVCGVTVSNASGVAGTCSGGSGGLASCLFDGASSEILGPGDHTVAVVGTAVQGATASCTSYLHVVDTEKPVVTCANQRVECTGNGGATVTPNATCTDNCSCAESCVTSLFPVGTSPGSCTATDPSGNSASCTPTITVVDTTPPVVAPRPGPSTLQCHVDAWTDPGATALDQCVGDLTAGLKTSGVVDPTHVGSYTETYSAVDPSGNVGSAPRSVAVVDTLAPVITLNPSPAVLQCGVDVSVEAGAKAVDACAGDLTSKISETGAVNTATAGTYTLTYSVADPSGNAASAARPVTVIDTLPPATTATASPNPPGNRYININVTSYSVVPRGGGAAITGSADCWTSPGIAVALRAVDACSLEQITYSLTGAQTTGATTVAGGFANVAVTTTGSTTLSYYATDKAGNIEAAKTLPLFIGRSQQGFGFSCAPSPSLKNLPRHGTVTATGTVTFTNPLTGQRVTKPFSFTYSY